MTIHEEILKISNGAYFRRADLHIHSFGELGSYDVTDASMTPEAIVDTAIAEKLEVIAITDHNSIGNVRRALKHAEGKNVLRHRGISCCIVRQSRLWSRALENCTSPLTARCAKKQFLNALSLQVSMKDLE